MWCPNSRFNLYSTTATHTHPTIHEAGGSTDAMTVRLASSPASVLRRLLPLTVAMLVSLSWRRSAPSAAHAAAVRCMTMTTRRLGTTAAFLPHARSLSTLSVAAARRRWQQPTSAPGGLVSRHEQAPSRLAAVVSRSSSRRKTTASTTGGGSSGGGKNGLPSIPLSPEERQLFDTLLAVVEDEQLGTTLRVAGGWVRDKVLGHWSPDGKIDIDIALDNMMGSEFAATLNRWLAKRGRKMYNVGIISANPEKSKHLETATMRVGTFWIDFVNLRTESYTDESRIPSMDIGSPHEDALRRDLTINSLFFNMNTGEVEDFSGQGLTDMRDGIIRTPLPAFTTLLDDPLRVLRAVRFASRLDFAMSSDLVDAASDPRVHKALAQKVSRERIGSEVDLMMRSAKPARAMTLIGELGLSTTVFPAPPSVVLLAAEEGTKKEEEVGDAAAPPRLAGTWFRQGLKALVEMEMGLRFKNWGLTSDEVRLVLYAALLLPLAGVRYVESPKKHKPQEVSRYVFARMLKLKAKDADKVVLLHEVVGCFQPFLSGRQLPLEAKEKRARIGALLLQVGPLWRAALLLAAVKCSLEGSKASSEAEKVSYRDAALRVSTYIGEVGLDEVWAKSPPFDGEGLRRILPNIPNGPPFRQVMDEQVQVWLREPEISEEEMGTRLVAAFPLFLSKVVGEEIGKQ